MRFMVIVKATRESEAGEMPSDELIAAMDKFNQELIDAGVRLDAVGLQSSAHGARIRFAGNKRTVIDGPFAETKDLVAGYWVIDVKSLQEAIDWMKRCPNPHNAGEAELEIRQCFEAEDFANAPPEMVEQEKKFRAAKK